MFTVRYGNDQQKIFNSNCQAVNLLNYIKHACGYSNIDIDLAEESTGQILYMPDNPLEYASSYIKPRTNYVPVQISSNYNY
ncbi:MAG: hypothetical protein ACK42K_01030 [Leptonema sp. (in: bacteria)]